jgi:RNA polymerase sigma-70 factor (ECF subfamily)
LARWQSGDADAARLLFQRYAAQLIALAHAHLPKRMVRRFDAEDVVQSAMRSFFAAARERRYTVERSGDLWHLLATMTLNRLYRRIKHHRATKRTVHREAETPPFLEGISMEALAEGPSPEDAVVLADELEQVLAEFDPLKRVVIELRLQDYTLNEIAAHTQRSQRTVRRSLEQIKQALEHRSMNPPV